MRIVITMLTISRIADGDKKKAESLILQRFNKKVTSSQYDYIDRKYFETDFDIWDIEFTKETLNDGIDKLILLCEGIMEIMPMQTDFIIANDDTEVEIATYEKNVEDIKNFGLFVTNRFIPNLTPYYSSKKCNAYVNFKYTSFGVY